MREVVKSRIWGVSKKMRGGELPKEIPDETDGGERRRGRALDLNSKGTEVPFTPVVEGWAEQKEAMRAPEVFACRDILRGKRE